ADDPANWSTLPPKIAALPALLTVPIIAEVLGVSTKTARRRLEENPTISEKRGFVLWLHKEKVLIDDKAITKPRTDAAAQQTAKLYLAAQIVLSELSPGEFILKNCPWVVDQWAREETARENRKAEAEYAAAHPEAP